MRKLPERSAEIIVAVDGEIRHVPFDCTKDELVMQELPIDDGYSVGALLIQRDDGSEEVFVKLCHSPGVRQRIVKFVSAYEIREVTSS